MIVAANVRKMPSAPYGGYDAIAASEPDMYLAATDRGDPAGEYLRRFWQPVCLSSELGEFPVAITVMGERLVVFRDLSGNVGLVHRDCSHRGTSLEFGLIVENGIRCAYHGWHYAPDGSILEAPGELYPGTIAKRMCHPAYPVHEVHGLVFAYMGPPADKPPFPNYDFLEFEDEDFIPFAWSMPCNWLQVRENTQDPIHLTYLHTMFTVKQFGGDATDLPLIKAYPTPIGQITTSTREAGPYLSCRINEVILPNIARVPDLFATGAGIPANKAGVPEEGKVTAPLKYKVQFPASHRLGLTAWVVPIDNHHCVHIGWVHMPKGEDPEVTNQWIEQVSFGQTGDRPLDERRRNPGDWDAMVAQGVVAIHENENLTGADIGVALYRRRLREAVRAVERGEEASAAPTNGGTIQSYAHMIVEPAQGSEGGPVRTKADFEKLCVESVLAGTWPDEPRRLV